MNINLNKNYNAISKNGDTLELSEAGTTQRVHTGKKDLPLSGRSSIVNSSKTGYSDNRIK